MRSLPVGLDCPWTGAAAIRLNITSKKNPAERSCCPPVRARARPKSRGAYDVPRNVACGPRGSARMNGSSLVVAGMFVRDVGSGRSASPCPGRSDAFQLMEATIEDIPYCIQIHSSSGWHRIMTGDRQPGEPSCRGKRRREEPEGLTDLSWTRSAPCEGDIRTRRKKTVARSTCEQFR
jgi:hypothetical protein